MLSALMLCITGDAAIFTFCMVLIRCNNHRRAGVGCQEETYDNYAFMFSGTIIYMLSQVFMIFLAVISPEDTRFTLLTPDGSLQDYPLSL